MLFSVFFSETNVLFIVNVTIYNIYRGVARYFFFGSDRSPRRGNLILGLVVSEIFETRLSGYLWVWGLSLFIGQRIVKGGEFWE